MFVESWNIDRWREMLDMGGTISALLFAGAGFHIDARVRRAETLLEITKQHRELWIYFGDHPELAGLLDAKRDMRVRPLADGEIRFANFLFLHLRASYGATRAGINKLPEHLAEDWHDLLNCPAIAAAWERMRRFHDRKFVKIVDSFR